jgi:vitamin B12/bleomycin/antimicrobial peptide transport system ATP-binding/permease protein
MEAYLSDRTYYRLDSATGVANPDQRITEDVRAFTTTTLSFLLLIINGTLTAISFSGVLWSISPTLFGVAVAYAICGSLLTIWLGKPLIRLNYNQFDMEANFRSDLIHVRENSELIALAHREGRFKARLSRRLDALAANFRRLIRINRNLGFFTIGYNYLIQIIPALIVAPMFILGGVQEFGVITQSAMAFATLLGAFSLIVTQFQSISAFTAVTARLYQLSDAMEKAHLAPTCAIEIGQHQDVLSYEEVTLYSADQSRRLVAGLNFQIARGARWLITAADDAQKVALFRATASVWECGGGRIIRPSLDEILFLPERPYLPPGTLRDVLLRTGMEAITSDAEIHAAMLQFGVAGIITRAGGLDSEQDWDELLSIGEQHLISVCRIVLAKPAFVFLDRPGSSLPKNQIAEILDFLTAQQMGVVILAKNGESRLHYDGHLELHPDASWDITYEPTHTAASELDHLDC